VRGELREGEDLMTRFAILALLFCACSIGARTGSEADASLADAAAALLDGSELADSGHTTADASHPVADAGSRPDGATAGIDSGPEVGLAAKYPGDLGIDKDPAVVWAENFEEGSVASVVARYDQVHQTGMELVADVPPGSGGAASLKLTAGVSNNACDLYKELPDHEELYLRWYVKYQAGINWHHSGVWFGGYNPASKWPSPQAGLKPNGDDRFSISIEPIYDIQGAHPRLDTYDYWMTMHSWMDNPSGTTAYYGNALVHQNSFTVDEGQWMCIEVHARLNTDLASGKGAILEVFKNDALVQRFDEAGPLGYWIKDKFCPKGADGKECTDYPAPFDTVLDLQMRTTANLKFNAFWPQNYITDGPDGSLQYDDMVVATTRIGCLKQ
jgi:hypothetical protein